MNKIFCIGLNKTGTTSIHLALIRLGYKSLHWGGFESDSKIETALRDGEPILSHLSDKYDAYSDIAALTSNFDIADRHYPGSKFIMTWRDLDSWLVSRTEHVKRNIAGKERGVYKGSWLTIDHAEWTEEWHQHHDRVVEYFRRRDGDLLEFNCRAGDGYGKLCRFLRKPIVEDAFPWSNRRF